MRRAMNGILKRKFEEVEASSSPCSSVRESDDEVSCSESGDSSDSVNPSATGLSHMHELFSVWQMCAVDTKINVIIFTSWKAAGCFVCRSQSFRDAGHRKLICMSGDHGCSHEVRDEAVH